MISTTHYVLDAAGRLWIPVERSWHLNEHHYGVLQGKNRKEVRDKYDEEQLVLWRHSFDITPPAIEIGTEFSQDSDPCYLKEVPTPEYLKDAIARLMLYWESILVPAIRTGKIMVIGVHGNSLRTLVEYLDDINDEDIIGVSIPTDIPLVYELDKETLKPVRKGGTYLDLEIEAKIAAVASRGKRASNTEMSRRRLHMYKQGPPEILPRRSLRILARLVPVHSRFSV